jgi:hypothetical protein
MQRFEGVRIKRSSALPFTDLRNMSYVYAFPVEAFEVAL